MNGNGMNTPEAFILLQEPPSTPFCCCSVIPQIVHGLQDLASGHNFQSEVQQPLQLNNTNAKLKPQLLSHEKSP